MHQEGRVCARVKSATTRSQSRRIALPTQASSQGNHCSRCEHLPSRHPVAPKVPDSTAKQQAQMGPHVGTAVPARHPQAPPGSQTVWSPASRTRASRGSCTPATTLLHSAPSQATAGCTTGQPMKVCNMVSSWATQQLAEQQTVPCTSCMPPTVHQGATTARHRSDPCSSSHPKCRVNLSNLGSVNDS
jgi:hypothetical protein